MSAALLAGHGAQKLFGAFEEPGPEGTAGMMEAIGFRPGRYRGTAAGASELAGGLLTALGFLNPLGPLAAGSSMIVAARKVHRGKPGVGDVGRRGAAAHQLSSAERGGAGRSRALSLDRLFGIRLLAWWFSLLAFATAGAGSGARPRGGRGGAGGL